MRPSGLGIGLGAGLSDGAIIVTALPLKDQVAWTHLFEGGVGMVPSSPGDFVSWADQIDVLSIVPADVGHAQVDLGPAVHFSNNVNQRVRVATKLIASGTDFGLYVRLRTDGGPSWIPVAFDRDGAADRWLYLSFNASSWTVECYDGVLNPQMGESAILGTTYHDLFIGRTGAALTAQLNERTPRTPVSGGAVDLTIPTNLSLGNLMYTGGGLSPNSGAIRIVGWKAGADFTDPEKAAIRAYNLSRGSITWDGDSLTAESIPGLGHGYPGKVMLTIGDHVYKNVAVSGHVSTDCPHAGFDTNATSGVYVLLVGHNDILAGASAAQLHTNVLAVYAAAKAAGFRKVIGSTVFASALLPGIANTRRLEFLDLLDANHGQADAIIDHRVDARFEVVANFANGVIGDDGTHPNEAGCVLQAAFAAPVISSVLASL